MHGFRQGCSTDKIYFVKCENLTAYKLSQMCHLKRKVAFEKFKKMNFMLDISQKNANMNMAKKIAIQMQEPITPL